MLGAYLAAFKTYVPSRFVFNIKSTDSRRKTQISDDSRILTAGAIPQYPCKVSCKAAWNIDHESIGFQRVLLKQDGRTKFGGKNPMQQTVIEWESKIANADHFDEDVILPLVLYLSSARLWKDGNKRTVKTGVLSRTDAYSHCLDAQHGLDIAFRYIDTLKVVAVEENDGKNFPAYEVILWAVNEAFRDELKSGEKIIFSTKYEDDIIALAGIFTGAGYMVDSNKEHGEGRSDVVVYDSINARVAIFEAKYTKVLGNLESECDTALRQINDRMYAKEYEDDYDQILCYGISFFKKRCMVKKK